MSMDTLVVDQPWLMLGDCLERMRGIPDGSVDMVLADLPYGTTTCAWDSIIPFEPLWDHYRRVIKGNGAIVLTASQPFTTELISSNRKMFKYELIWNKERGTEPQLANIRPMKAHENIAVFSRGRTTYNPQMIPCAPYTRNRKTVNRIDGHGQSILSSKPQSKTYSEKYPISIVVASSASRREHYHPAQKPVDLFEYLIRTYTNPGEVVLDNCFGSGTTGVACVNTGRRFIGIEQHEPYFDIARKRIDAAIAALQPAPQGGLFDAQAAE